jgi:tight adherence protein B
LLGVAAPVIGAALLGAVPWLYRKRKQNKRLAEIEEQFPEALDFLGRSLRAGNAFSVGLELLALEVSGPLKIEVQRVTRELALGANLEDAFNGLMHRVELVEVRLFVSAVLLQKETGGNLNEILAKLSLSVRERLRLQGQVKAMSGQGRLTAAVLSVLPVILMIVLRIISPHYLDSLTGDAMGRNMLAGGTVSQMIGFIVMRKIITFEV